ncbi:MAG TPA: serine/threonine-protein kinase [Polyangiaceae bacterium]|nr:serine/threonine-protein kinase [Polyangiaceae bacterium]
MSDTTEDRAQELVGKTLGEGYQLEALIGQGSMGAVYRARTASAGEVALKTLHPQMMGGDLSPRFLRESELVRGLRHPHVVRTLDAGKDESTGLLFLVMPLLKGRDLDQVLEELGALAPQTAVRITLQAARGLNAAHRIGIIHRDVKPGNLILDEEAHEILVRVCDFGIAKQMGGEESLTQTGSQLGTPDYVSPEQLRSSKHVDERTDIWSLGATLYQMLCGGAPYAHIESVFDLITAIIGEDVPHIQDRAPWIEPGLALIVHKALMRDPNQRWATMEEMATALRPFSGHDERLDPHHIRAIEAASRLLVAERANLSDASSQTSMPLALSARADELGLINRKLDGRYLVKCLIGKGGMGSVYEVESPSGERLAAKVVSAGVQGANPATLQRFAREARASSAISSLNVVRTVDAGCDDKLGFPYIIMEMLHGVDLSSVAKREGALPSEVAVRLMVQAARGVAAAHARGVVHRDIKPANLFLNQDQHGSEVTVKVCDFGVAKRVGSFGISSGGVSHYSLTRSGGMLGSPMYMSPEQARNAKAVDERTDVWSLSVVLWEALSGQRLWGGHSSLGELIVAICTEPIQRLEIAAPWVPHDLARVVMRGLERDPEKRTPSARALIEAIEIFGGNSDRLVMSQLVGLTEEQRGELTLRVNLSDSAARRIADLGKNLGQKAQVIEIGSVSTIAASSRSVARPGAGGSGKGAMVAVAVLSAAIAGGTAYYFAHGAPAEAPPVAAASASAAVNARIQVVPADARVITRHGVLPIVEGEVVLRGQAGDTVNVTVSQGAISKTFAVSLGSDGIATPGRLVLQ